MFYCQNRLSCYRDFFPIVVGKFHFRCAHFRPVWKACVVFHWYYVHITACVTFRTNDYTVYAQWDYPGVRILVFFYSVHYKVVLVYHVHFLSCCHAWISGSTTSLEVISSITSVACLSCSRTGFSIVVIAGRRTCLYA